jgi:hypothetical protein
MSLYTVSIVDAYITQHIHTMTGAKSFQSLHTPDGFTYVLQPDDIRILTGMLTAE